MFVACLRWTASCAWLLAGATAPAVAGSFTFMTINGTSSSSAAMAISDSNEVAGWDFNSTTSRTEGFIWSGGVTTEISDGTSATRFLAINTREFVAGEYDDSTGHRRPFLYAARLKTFSPINLGGTFSGYVAGLSLSNVIAGYSASTATLTSARGLLTDNRTATLFRYPGATLCTQATAINAGGTVTGTYQSQPSSTHGFVLASGTYTSIDVPGAASTFPKAIGPTGMIGGSYTDASDLSHGFIEVGGKYATLDDPNGVATSVTAIGPNNQVFGNYLDLAHNSHGFIYRGGSFAAADFPSAVSTKITSANALGSFAGYWVDSAQVSHAFVALCTSSPCAP
jgi:hypothetical protein